MRHIVAVLDPRTGTHRLAGLQRYLGEDENRFTTPPEAVPAVVAHMKPQPHEAALVLSVHDTEPTKPKTTLKSV